MKTNAIFVANCKGNLKTYFRPLYLPERSIVARRACLLKCFQFLYPFYLFFFLSSFFWHSCFHYFFGLDEIKRTLPPPPPLLHLYYTQPKPPGTPLRFEGSGRGGGNVKKGYILTVKGLFYGFTLPSLPLLAEGRGACPPLAPHPLNGVPEDPPPSRRVLSICLFL